MHGSGSVNTNWRMKNWVGLETRLPGKWKEGEEYLLFMWDGGPRQPAVERSELYKERRSNTLRAISAILYTTDV